MPTGVRHSGFEGRAETSCNVRDGWRPMMTFACTDCSRCGKCYEKKSTCTACGGEINLLDACCPSCGEPITDEMRARAKRAYMDKKKIEHDEIVALAAAAKARREREQAKTTVVYPWEES